MEAEKPNILFENKHLFTFISFFSPHFLTCLLCGLNCVVYCTVQSFNVSFPRLITLLYSHFCKFDKFTTNENNYELYCFVPTTFELLANLIVLYNIMQTIVQKHVFSCELNRN